MGNVLDEKVTAPDVLTVLVSVTFGMPATVPVHVEPEQEISAKVNEPTLMTTEVDETLPPVPTTPPKLSGDGVTGSAALAAAEPGAAKPPTSRNTIMRYRTTTAPFLAMSNTSLWQASSTL